MLQPLLGFDFGIFPIYQIMLCIAFLAGWITLNRSFKKMPFSKFMRKRIRKCFFIGTLFGIAGANMINWFVYEHMLDYSLYYRVTQGGYSFYFGMLCFFGVSALMLRLFKINVKYSINMIVPSVLIAQLIARLGCSLRGCCFGHTVTLFDVSFPLPIRELEAVFALVLLIVLSKRAFIKRFPIYLFSYSLFRFITDFFRGDDRGALFGITALSPTQLVSIIVILITGAVLFTRPILRLFKGEQLLDNVQSKTRSFFDGIRQKLFPKKARYEPLPFEYPGPAKKRKALKIIVSILLVIALLCSMFVFINPFNMGWVDNLRYSVTDAFSFLFEAKGIENEIGDTNGMSLVDVSAKGVIKDTQAALTLIQSYDTWADFEFGKVVQKTLANDNIVYSFHQTLDGKPILGKTRALVADKNGNALYMVGDAANLSYSKEVLSSYNSYTPTIKEAFGSKVRVLEKESCWYDTGDGLVNAQHAVLTDDGKTGVIGVVVQPSNNQILCYTTPQLGSFSTIEHNNIRTAANTVRELLKANNETALEELCHRSTDVHELEAVRVNMEKTLALAYKNSGLTCEEFATVLDSADTVSESVPSLNTTLYRDIVASETKQSLINVGQTDETAEACAQSVKDSFNSTSNVPAATDEPAMTLSAEKAASSFRHSINFKDDVDVYELECEENHAINITVVPETPVTVKITDADHRSVVSMYIDAEETLTLYPEDGNQFTMQVCDDRAAVSSPNATSNYKITLQATPEEIPTYITNTLRRIEDAYEYSNLTAFISMYAADGNQVVLEDAVALGILAPMVDSCASDCSGVEDGIDTAKTGIASMMVHDFVDYASEMDYLRDTNLELTYFHHIETESGTAVKAQIAITMDNMDIYRGYTFLKLEQLESTSTADMNEAESALAQLSSFFFGENYYITALNTDALFSTFGDTRNSISSNSDVASLYDLWECESEKVGDMYITRMTINKTLAQNEGHSAEKIESFQKYTIRHNLMTVKRYRASLQAQMDFYLAFSTLGEPIMTLIDAVTDPFGTLADKVFEQNEVTNTLWTVAKFIVNPVDTAKDYVVDEMMDDLYDLAENEADRIAVNITVLDATIQTYYDEYNKFNAA